MTKKKNKFFTFICSLVPGVGHMYMGFMKEGCSLLTLFSFTILIGSWLNMGPIMFILPIIWFYSFFDSMNKRSLSDSEFAALKDDYLFELDKIFIKCPDFLLKNKTILAIIFIFIGVTILWNNFINIISRILPSALMNAIYRFSNSLPQLIFAIFIIIVGVKLILGKKSELEKEFHSEIPKGIPNNGEDKEMN